MDEYIRLDTTIIGIDNLISKASTIEEANALFKAKDVIYSQQRYLTDVQPVRYGRWVSQGADVSKAITREQFAEAAKQLMNEFTANDGYGTSASATFLALCFGNLELRLFGMDGDSDDKT